MKEPSARSYLFNLVALLAFLALTIAAAYVNLGPLKTVVAMAIFTMTGGPEVVSMVFGALALAGLAAHAAGFDPPRLVVLGWWLSLVIYLAVGFYQLVVAAA